MPKALSAKGWWRSRWPARVATVAVVAALSASLPGTARGQAPPPRPGAAAVSQYVELVPTASGPTAPGVETERRTPLPEKARHALDHEHGSVADALGTIASSSDYGAPPKPRNGAAERALRTAPPTADEPSLDQALRALTTSTTSAGDDARLVGLLLVLGAVAVGGAGLAVRRRL